MGADAVLLFGDINVDNIFTMPEIPQPGRDGLATHAEMHLGGAVCNTAVMLAGLGQPARLVGAVGQDRWCDVVYESLDEAGVDRRWVVEKPEDGTGLIFIAVTPNGERTMLSYRGANRQLAPEDVPPVVMDGVGLLQLSGYVFLDAPQRETAFHLIKLAADCGIPISMDTGLDPVIHQPDVIRRVLPHLALLVTGTQEAARLTGKKTLEAQMAALLAMGVSQVAVKLGEEGACLAWDGGQCQRPAFPVTVRDTTSAGDSFSAGLIFAYLRGWPPQASLIMANLLGGLATTVYGAARFDRSAVLAYLRELRQRGDPVVAQPGVAVVTAGLKEDDHAAAG